MAARGARTLRWRLKRFGICQATICEMLEADLVAEESDSRDGIMMCISEHSLQS
jgi:hypothetical protein